MGMNKTNGFDLVIEIAEDPIVGALGDSIDANDFLRNMFGGDSDFGFGWELGALSSEFSFDVSFDRDESEIDSAQTNAVDIRMAYSMGLVIAGVEHEIDTEVRWIVGAEVNETVIDGNRFAQPVLNFSDKLYVASIDMDLGWLESLLPGDLEAALYAPLEAAMRNSLQTLLQKMPMAFPLQIHPDTDDAEKPKAMDLVTIGDDVSSPNALAICIGFGGTNGGDLAAFTSSFLESASDDPEEPREPAWAMMDFHWIARLIVAGLKQTETFEDAEFTIEDRRCALSDKIEIDDGIWLDRFAIEFDPSTAADKFSVSGKVAKRGFCYEASAEIGGDISIAVENADEDDGDNSGSIVVTGSVADPDIDLDIPWYCWLVGVLTFGLLFGPIGIGVVIAVAIIVESIEGIFDWIADEVVNAVNGVIGAPEIPTGKLKLKPVDAFIDDASLIYDVEVQGIAPIRCEGYALLGAGQGLELDKGKVISAQSVLCDLRYDGEQLSVGCGATLAEPDSNDFERWLRFRLYDLDYNRPASIAREEMQYQIDLGFMELTIPSLRVFAVRSDQGRYSVVQVATINDDYVRVRYRTYEGPISSLQIDGDFRCPPAFSKVPVGEATFIPSNRKEKVKQCGCANLDRDKDSPNNMESTNLASLSAHNTHTTSNTSGESGALSHATLSTNAHELPELLKPDTRCFRESLRHNHELLRFYQKLNRVARACGESQIGTVTRQQQEGSSTLVSSQPVSAQQLIQVSRSPLPKLSNQYGKFVVATKAERSQQATFHAIAVGLGSIARVSWRIDGKLLENEGSVTLPTGGLEYHTSDDGMQLHVKLTDTVATEFALACEVEDKDGRREHRARCVRYTPDCSGEQRVFPQTTAQLKQLTGV